MAIPDSFRTTVLGRIRLLDRAQRGVLTCASVIGQRFDVAVLIAAWTGTEGQVRAALERASALQLITAGGPEAEHYAFRHALTRDVIYAELITGRTRPLHRRIARALEEVAATRDVPIDALAYHSWAAGDARRAVRYNELAGDGAAGVHAKDDARRYYDRARGLIAVDSGAYARLTSKLAGLDAGEREPRPPLSGDCEGS